MEGMKVGGSHMNTKKAILVVSFGTSYENTRKKTIEKIEQDLSNGFHQYVFARAFTSKMIINKLKKRDGLFVDTPQEALDKLAEEGFEEIIIQPTHIINGSEYEKLLMKAMEYKNKFNKIYMGKPLLSSVEDYEKVANHMVSILPEDISDNAVILMGHGSDHPSNSAYPCMDYIFKSKGFKNIYIATVEGYPSLEMVIDNIKDKYSKVLLVPFMIVAGDHVQEDMVGDDEDSWKNTLDARGFKVSSRVIGMGEIPQIREMFVNHARQATLL